VGGPLVTLFVLDRIGLSSCPVAAITRHPCPGCGLTRATLLLLRGDVAGALHMHPLSPLVVPLFGGFFAYGVATYLRSGRWPATQGPAAGRVAVVGLVVWTALVAVWIARFWGAFGGPVPV
jgi:hypothetical protein